MCGHKLAKLSSHIHLFLTGSIDIFSKNKTMLWESDLMLMKKSTRSTLLSQFLYNACPTRATRYQRAASASDAACNSIILTKIAYCDAKLIQVASNKANKANSKALCTSGHACNKATTCQHVRVCVLLKLHTMKQTHRVEATGCNKRSWCTNSTRRIPPYNPSRSMLRKTWSFVLLQLSMYISCHEATSDLF